MMYRFFSLSLSLPDSLDSLSHTNVVCLEFVETNRHGEGCCSQEPLEKDPGLRYPPCWDVINDESPILKIVKSDT
jgi:hypothetical protein